MFLLAIMEKTPVKIPYVCGLIEVMGIDKDAMIHYQVNLYGSYQIQVSAWKKL